MERSLEDLLATLPPASSLSEGDRAKLAAIAALEEAPVGTVLFREGEPSGAAWLVAAGRVALSMSVPGRPATSVLTLGRGDLLGWSALTLEPRRVATGQVVEAATLIRLQRDALLALCDGDHDIGYALMHLAFVEVAQRLHDTRLQMLDLFGGQP